MNKPYKPWLMFIPVLFLGMVALASRPTPRRPKPISPAEQARRDKLAEQMAKEQMARQRRSLEIEARINRERLKHAKHVIIQNGQRVASETDESDNWFRNGTDGPVGTQKAPQPARR